MIETICMDPKGMTCAHPRIQLEMDIGFERTYVSLNGDWYLVQPTACIKSTCRKNENNEEQVEQMTTSLRMCLFFQF